MTEQQAHDLLHARLPVGSTVTVSQHAWSQTTTTAGNSPVECSPRTNWYVAVTVREGSEVTQGELAHSMAEAVEALLARVTGIVSESRSPDSPAAAPPPLFTAPSTSPSRESQDHRRDAS